MAVMDRVRRGEHDLDGLGFEVLALVTAALDPDPARRPTLPELVARTGGDRSVPGNPRVDAPTPTMTMPIAAAPDFTATEQLGTAGTRQAATDPTAHQPVMEPERQPYQQPPAPQQGAFPGQLSHPVTAQRTPWVVRVRRWLLGLALLGVVGASVAVAPWVTCFVVATVVILCRSTSLFTTAAAQRRNRRGTKWYDAPLDVVSAPWHFLVSLPLSLVLLNACSAGDGAHAQGAPEGEVATAQQDTGVPLYDNLGNHHFAVRASDRAQRYFDQGMRLYYAFNHAEAIRAFNEAARLDPECAMCYWGTALAYGPNINMPMDSASGVAAYGRAPRKYRIGSSCPGIGGWWWTTCETTVPRPEATTYSRSKARQAGQVGPGGCRSTPQLLHFWMRSSSAAVPSQKNSVSRFLVGWSTNFCSRLPVSTSPV